MQLRRNLHFVNYYHCLLAPHGLATGLVAAALSAGCARLLDADFDLRDAAGGSGAAAGGSGGTGASGPVTSAGGGGGGGGGGEVVCDAPIANTLQLGSAHELARSIDLDDCGRVTTVGRLETGGIYVATLVGDSTHAATIKSVTGSSPEAPLADPRATAWRPDGALAIAGHFNGRLELAANWDLDSFGLRDNGFFVLGKLDASASTFIAKSSARLYHHPITTATATLLTSVAHAPAGAAGPAMTFVAGHTDAPATLSVKQSADGSEAMYLLSEDSASREVVLLGFDAQGASKVRRTWGKLGISQRAEAIAVDDAHIAIVGSYKAMTTDPMRGFVALVNRAGLADAEGALGAEVTWSGTFGRAEPRALQIDAAEVDTTAIPISTDLNAVVFARNGNLIVGGSSTALDLAGDCGAFEPGVDESLDGVVMELDGDGHCVWARRVGGEGPQEVRSVAQDPSTGDIFVMGVGHNTADVEGGKSAPIVDDKRRVVFVARFSSTGVLLSSFFWSVVRPGLTRSLVVPFVSVAAKRSRFGATFTGKGAVEIWPGTTAGDSNDQLVRAFVVTDTADRAGP